ncbi:hypothetical protein [Nocardia farcinica]|uniref:hypothetical protein n=1 Tax=Nocardia farcinica TaxID=37329 RepID=UPI00189584DC|nr:hypothetical protein [Nocardia farcinica]MBF6411060.1 hypothetical protein [Nocardia farcinica]
MRKRLASALIRLAHYIYRPNVTDLTAQFDGVILVGAGGSYRHVPLMPPERRESRGWN